MRQITFNECNLYVLSLCVFAWARMPCHGDDDWWGSSARARSRCGLTPVQVVRDNNGVMHRDCVFVWRHLRCDKMPLFAVCLCMPCICHSRLSFAAASVCYSFLCVHSLDLHNNKSDKLVDRSSGSNSSVSRKQNRRKQIREQQKKKIQQQKNDCAESIYWLIILPRQTTTGPVRQMQISCTLQREVLISIIIMICIKLNGIIGFEMIIVMYRFDFSHWPPVLDGR